MKQQNTVDIGSRRELLVDDTLLEEVNRRVIRLRVVLEGARFYTFRIAS